MFFSKANGISNSRALLCGSSLTVLAMALAGHAYGQEANSAAPATEVVTVTATGTMIKGISPVGSNMISVDADAMKQAGAITSNQILEQVPQLANAFNSNVAAPTAGNFSGFRPQLRSLPSQNIVGGAATLLLMDGHNMVGVSALGTAPDASVVPTVVLQRVDVLPDGASATYGANAITGVINFITRDRFDGLQFNGDLGLADSYTSLNLSAIGGTSWEGGSAYLAIQHTENTVLLGADREYTGMNLTSIGGRDSRSTTCALPNITAGTRNYAQTGYPNNTPGSLAGNVAGPFPGLNTVTNAGSLNRCDTNSVTSTFPSLNQTGVFGSFRQELGSDIIFTTKMLWNTRYQFSLGPQLSSTQTITSANPFFQSLGGETSQRVQFGFDDALNNKQRKTTNSVQVFQITPQLTAPLHFSDWEITLWGNYGRSSTNAIQLHNLNSQLLTTAITSGIGGQFFDPYNIKLTDPTLLGNIVGQTSGQEAHQHLLQGEAVVNGTVFELPGGPLKVAIGGRYDWEDFVSIWNNSLAVPTPAAVHRVVNSAFGEIHVPVVSDQNSLPLVRSLSLDISGRIDDYSVIGSTENFKIGVSWQPVDGLTIRGTRGTSFDAPSLADTSAPDGRYQLQINNTPNPYVPPGTSNADALRPTILVPGGNPNLGPELGSTWSIGADFAPTQVGGMDLTGLQLGVTYYHIAIEHQIGLLFNTPLLFQVPSYRSLYIVNPTPQQAATYGYTTLTNFPGTTLDSAWAGPPNTQPYLLYDARRNNLGNSILSGLDFSGSYTVDAGFGDFTAGFSGTYSLQNDTAGSAAGPFQSIQKTSVPLYAVSAFAQLVTGPWNFRTSLQHSPGFNVDPATQAYSLYGQKHIGSFTTVNAHAGYDMSDLAKWLNQTEVSVTINNVFDEDPPIYLHGGSNLPANSGVGIVANGSTLGRYVVLSVQKLF